MDQTDRCQTALFLCPGNTRTYSSFLLCHPQLGNLWLDLDLMFWLFSAVQDRLHGPWLPPTLWVVQKSLLHWGDQLYFQALTHSSILLLLLRSAFSSLVKSDTKYMCNFGTVSKKSLIFIVTDQQIPSFLFLFLFISRASLLQFTSIQL